MESKEMLGNYSPTLATLLSLVSQGFMNQNKMCPSYNSFTIFAN